MPYMYHHTATSPAAFTPILIPICKWKQQREPRGIGSAHAITRCSRRPRPAVRTAGSFGARSLHVRAVVSELRNWSFCAMSRRD